MLIQQVALKADKALTTALRTDIDGVIERTKGVDHKNAAPSSPDENLKTEHTSSTLPIRLDGAQTIPTDEAKALQSKELITVGNVIKVMKNLKTVLEQPRETYSLIGNNPTMKMEISPAGTAAQMQVIDKDTGHDVAT